MATVYPDFERDGFYLENAVMRAKLWPQDFVIPSEDERHRVHARQTVKMDFTFALESQPKEGDETERMWVVVKERVDDHWIGVLDNDPRFHDAIESGHEFHFHPDHIVAIWRDS